MNRSESDYKVSILVLMDLCIKTLLTRGLFLRFSVSILVLMDLCIKTISSMKFFPHQAIVSILVLMDLCIKTIVLWLEFLRNQRFNPCFNGSMYKN